MMRNIRLMLLLSGSWLAGVPLSPSAQAAVIYNVGTSGCLTTTDSNAADSSPVSFSDCIPGLNQQWTFDGFEIIGPNGKCLDVLGGGIGDLTPVDYFHCYGGSAQLWYYSYGKIIYGANRMCLTVRALYVQPYITTCYPDNDNNSMFQKFYIF